MPQGELAGALDAHLTYLSKPGTEFDVKVRERQIQSRKGITMDRQRGTESNGHSKREDSKRERKTQREGGQ